MQQGSVLCQAIDIHMLVKKARGFNILQWKKEMARKNDKKQEPHRQATQGMQPSTLLKSQITAPQFTTSLLGSPYFQSCTHCANTQFLFSPCCSSSRRVGTHGVCVQAPSEKVCIVLASTVAFGEPCK